MSLVRSVTLVYETADQLGPSRKPGWACRVAYGDGCHSLDYFYARRGSGRDDDGSEDMSTVIAGFAEAFPIAARQIRTWKSTPEGGYRGTR